METFPSENGTKFLSDIPVDGSDGNATLWKYSYNILTIMDKMSIRENKKVRHKVILRMQAFTLLHATKHSLVLRCLPPSREGSNLRFALPIPLVGQQRLK
jgi:hypothetical protein